MVLLEWGVVRSDDLPTLSGYRRLPLDRRALLHRSTVSENTGNGPRSSLRLHSDLVIVLLERTPSPKEETAVSRYLIVAHRTIGSEELMSCLAQHHMTDPTGTYHLIVPVWYPADHIWTEGEIKARARERLELGLTKLRGAGLEVTGEIGDVSPITAVSVLLRRGEKFDGVIVSTLPHGMSRWLKLDVPSRLRREMGCDVELVINRTRHAA